MAEDEEDFSALKINSPSSHIALSGDLTITVAKSNKTLKNSKYKYEFKEKENENFKSFKNISNQFMLLR